MSPRFERTHDRDVYVAESRYETPKEYFKYLATRIDAAREGREDFSILDVGCAAGEFLYYLNTRFPAASLTGLDVVPELLGKAARHVPSARFVEGDVRTPNAADPQAYDYTFLIGVHSIFDDPFPVFDNLISWTRPGGRAWIFGLFNPNPVDVWISYRRPDVHPESHRELGWNMVSEKSVSDYLARHPQVSSFAFSSFELPFDLPPNPEDPARTWTFMRQDGRRLFTNGLGLICSLSALELTLHS